MVHIVQHAAGQKKFKVLKVSRDEDIPNMELKRIWVADESAELANRIAETNPETAIMLVPVSKKALGVHSNVNIVALPIPGQNIEPPYETNDLGKIAWYMGVTHGKYGDGIVRQ